MFYRQPRACLILTQIIPQAENLYGRLVNHAEWALDILPPDPSP